MGAVQRLIHSTSLGLRNENDTTSSELVSSGRSGNWLPLYAAQMVTIDDASMVEQALAQQQYSMMPAASGFKAVNTVQLPNGKVKVRYQQMYNGVPVYGTVVVATESSKGISQVYGQMAQQLEADLPTVTLTLKASRPSL